MRFIAMLFLGLTLGLTASGTEAAEARKGYLGVELTDTTTEDAEKLGWETPRGVKVVKPVKGDPAEKAGIQPGDVLLSLDGVEIENARQFYIDIAAKSPDGVVKLRLLRDGKEKTVSAILGTRTMAAADVPVPMLDTGGHMAKVIAVAFTPDGKQIVSASNDKTIRVWDVASDKTVRVIRGESAPGDWGTIYAMALSPDGRWLAVGGYLHGVDRDIATAVRLYDFATGKLEALLKGHENTIFALAFSRDGKRLISGSSDKRAIVWDVAARQRLFVLSGHTETVEAVAFGNNDDRVVTGSADETLRLWDASGKLIAEMTEHKTLEQQDKDPELWSAAVRSIDFSPVDQIIASGSEDGRVLLWDGQTGKFLRQLAFPGGLLGNSEISSVRFSPDGRWLLAASKFSGCLIYEVSTSTEFFDGKPRTSEAPFLGAGEDTPRCSKATAYSRDGRLAAAAYNSVIHLVDPHTGKAVKTLRGLGMSIFAAGIAEDGSGIAWGDSLEKVPGSYTLDKLMYQLRLPLTGVPISGPETINISASAQPEENPKSYIRRTTKHGSWSFEFRRVAKMLRNLRFIDISKDGKIEAQIDLDQGGAPGNGGETFTADGQTILVGMVGEIRAYDLAGNRLGAFIGHEGTVRDLAPSSDGRLLVSAGSDQTVRLWNLKTRELIVTLFRGTDGEWVMWTPQGYYDASGPGSEMIGWQINHGPDKEADYVTAAQLRKSLHRPDIVARAIQLASAEAAVKEAPGANLKLADLLAKPVPRFRIVSPSANATLSGGNATVEIALEATPDPVKLIRIQVNGRQIAERLPDRGGGFAPGALQFAVPLAKGRNVIRLVAVNETGETPAEIAVTHEGDGDLDKRGTLYILAVGVDKYPNIPGKDLRYSGADAKAFADAMETHAGPLHERVVKRVLVNGPAVPPSDVPTAANILNALAVLRQAKDTDTVMVFVAGHGENEGPNYRFLPTDTVLQGNGFLPASVVPWYAFQEAIETAKGRRILFLDTCHAGNSYNQRLSNDAYQANIIVYSAARWDQLSWENKNLRGGHGLFTYAAVEGVEGKAAKGDGGRITTLDLRDFLVARVTELAKQIGGQQEPQYFRARDAENYALARGQ